MCRKILANVLLLTTIWRWWQGSVLDGDNIQGFGKNKGLTLWHVPVIAPIVKSSNFIILVFREMVKLYYCRWESWSCHCQWAESDESSLLCKLSINPDFIVKDQNRRDYPLKFSEKNKRVTRARLRSPQLPINFMETAVLSHSKIWDQRKNSEEKTLKLVKTKMLSC